MNVFELFGTIAINNEQANKAIADTGKQAGGLSKTMESAFGKLQGTAKKIGAAVATAFAVDKIKDFGQSCAETYASVAAEQAAFSQVMGDYSEMATEKMNAVAENTGIVASRLTPYMTKMTAKFKGLGYGVDEATSLAQEGLTMAADASAFWDMSLDESMSHLNSFINGSYEGGEAIGLFANDTQMAAYALEKGIIKKKEAWSALDEATKQSVRMMKAKDQMLSSGITGQASAEQEEYANTLANVNEQFRQFQAIVGEPIMNNIMLPAMRRISSLMPGITEKTGKFVQTFSNGMNKAAAYFKNKFSGVFSGEGIDFGALGLAVGGVVGDVIGKISTMFSDLSADIPGLLENVGQAISTAWNGGVWPFIQGFFKAAFEIELPDWPTFVQNLSDGWSGQVWPAIQDFFKAKFGIDLPSWADTSAMIGEWWSGVVTGIGDIFRFVVSAEPPDWENLATDISDGWNTQVWPSIQNFFNAKFGIDVPDWATTSATISEWWNSVVTGMGDIFNALFSLELPSASSIVSEISSWWSGIKSSVSGLFNINANVSTSFGGGSSTGNGAGRTFTVDGSHAKGLDFVPRDNYLARLHKGEAVLTSAQADAWRSGSMGGADIGRLETAINGMTAMMQQLVASSRSGQQIVLDSGVLVGQLAPALDTQLGTISTRKGRRN